MEMIIKHKTPTAILTSDWHLREDTPVCRTDDYWSTQWKKVDFISSLQRKYNCPVFNAGDLFDNWKPSPNLLRETILHLPKQFYTNYGQHDLPQHNLILVNKCGINVLQAAGKLTVLHGVHWGQVPYQDISGQDLLQFGKVFVWHKMNYKGKTPWPGCTDPSALRLLKKYPQFDLILTGDNHMPFTEEYEGRMLVNPGSMMRMDADQINHRPRIYLWYAETNTIEPVYIPIVPAIKVMSREHIDQKKERDNRLEAFVGKLDGDWKTKMSFKQNLKIFIGKNKVNPNVVKIIYKSIERWH